MPSPSSNNEKDKYRPQNARWVIHYYNNNSTDIAVIATNQSGPFLVSSFDREVWLGQEGRQVSRAQATPVDILFSPGNEDGDGEKRGYSIAYASSSTAGGGDGTVNSSGYINVDGEGNVRIGETRETFKGISVTYYD